MPRHAEPILSGRHRAAAAVMLLLASAGPVAAQGLAPEHVTHMPVAAPSGSVLPLLPDDLELAGGVDEVLVPFDLPPDQPFDRATLDLSYSNALAVLPDRSSLTLSLNGRALGDLPLVGAQGVAAAQIELPAGAFTPGRNELRFQARQSHRLACSRERFGELWTRLKRDGSTLTLQRSAMRRPLDPGQVHGLLAASTYDGEPFTIATGPDLAGPLGVELGSRVAQAVALVRGERPLQVEAMPLAKLDWQDLAGRNLALIGTVGELAHLVGEEEAAALAEGRMLVRRLPGDPDHVALLFAGGDPAAVRRAVEGFVATAARPIDPPPFPEIPGAADLELAELGFRTREMPIGTTRPVLIRFRLPPTFYASDGQHMDLVLNYAYAAGLAATSALVVQVNDIPANMIRLDHMGGKIVDGARINLSLGMFHPGLNTIAIHPVLDPASPAACAGNGPALSLFDDSRVAMPAYARLAHGGQLHDLVDDAFPYGQEAADVMVSSRDAEAMGAAWTLLGKLAQRRGEVLDQLGFVPPGTVSDRHLLAVGTVGELPPSLTAKLDLAWTEPGPTKPKAAPAPVASDPRDRWKDRVEDEGTLWQRALRTMISVAGADPAATVPERPPVEMAPGSGGTALIEIASPWAAQRVATVLVADRAEHLAPGIARLIAEPLWSRLGGDRARWRAEADDVVGEQRNPPFALASPEADPDQWRLAALTWLAQNRWTWLGLMLGTLVLASMMTSLALRLRRH
ncbi:cellulose biosynthesis cyclic di-GMP-binding regulatory protein BcsB [Geminicoccus roseus]|uniref:cellulose biosynthesis cyclic di-GMP-binding regulatory protein BcsB n=1 Tax=Geminicoccus roseus TaxID=404900 RepID=UPI00040FBDB8|nr:cellulose biosynthesis cyclic di-GMP-binding regulatory protein BcsB [Geminicoccus roseus]